VVNQSSAHSRESGNPVSSLCLALGPCFRGDERDKTPEASMTTTTLSPAAMPRLDRPFLIAAVLGAAVLVALVALDGQPASAALVILGFALGVAFLKAEFSFTAAWRRFLIKGEAGGLLAALLLIAVAATVIVPVAALIPGFGGAIAPIGPSLVI